MLQFAYSVLYIGIVLYHWYKRLDSKAASINDFNLESAYSQYAFLSDLGETLLNVSQGKDK